MNGRLLEERILSKVTLSLGFNFKYSFKDYWKIKSKTFFTGHEVWEISDVIAWGMEWQGLTYSIACPKPVPIPKIKTFAEFLFFMIPSGFIWYRCSSVNYSLAFPIARKSLIISNSRNHLSLVKSLDENGFHLIFAAP